MNSPRVEAQNQVTGRIVPTEAYVFPASFAQQRLWFLHQYAPQSPVYNLASAFWMTGPLDTRGLRQALQEIMNRHEILRTTFTLREGELCQVVVSRQAWAWQEENLEELPETDRAEEIRKRLRQETQRPFDLAHGPVARSLLLHAGPEEHLFLVVLHHIIADGWSQGVFNREWSALYNLIAAGQAPRLEPLPLQYADYAVWQREWLREKTLDQQITYWRKRLLGAPRFLELPADRPRPALETFRGHTLELALDPAFTSQLKQLARQENATLFMLLLAAFKVLLFRHTGQEDIVIGTPIANRNREELEGLIGFFVNTLCRRTVLAGNPVFRELLAQVRADSINDYAHQDLPFEKLVEELQVDRDPSRSPLFQVMFAFQDLDAPLPRLTGLALHRYPLERDTAHYELTLFMETRADELHTRLEYGTDLFSQDRMQRFLEHWRVLLAAITRNPKARLADLPVLSPAEQARLLVEWNDTTVEPKLDGCVPRAFERQADRTPAAIAVLCGKQALSYAELNQRANQWAHYLQSLEAGPERLVGLCLDRSVDQMVALLGILKAGAGVVPMDPAHPAERLAFMANDSGCRWIITQCRLMDAFKAIPAKQILLEEFPGNKTSDNPPANTQPHHLAYLIYTSGSTGRPKGVAMEQRSLLNLLDWQLRQSAPGLRTLQFAPLSFDVSWQEIFSTWLSGGTLVLIRADLRADPEAMGDWIIDQGLERLFLPTAFLGPLADAIIRTGKHPDSLREIIVAGEPLRITPSMKTVFRHQPTLRLHNHYGPTETHVVTAYTLPTDAEQWPDSPPIGRPIANTKVYILDRHQQPVPEGVVGELYLGGAAVARGYWGQPELTAEKFLPDPFSSEARARLFRTGDLARYLPGGDIEFRGRLDRQVKIRGFRVEPGEIEAALLTHPEVQESVVLMEENPPGNRQLVAFVVTTPNAKVVPLKLRQHLAGRLPDYLLPSALVMIPKIPLTLNGKVDHEALFTLARKNPPPAEPPLISRNLLEHRLVRLWEEILGKKNIKPDDNFFDLGGHSLLATSLLAALEVLVGRRVPLATLFHAPTAAGMARAIEDQGAMPSWTSLVPLQPKGTRPPLFVTHGWGGDVFGFVPMARLLGADQPVYGLQAVGLDGRQERHQTVEEMAAQYATEIRSFQSQGPYYLAGHSCGGAIAYEIAQQLCAQGQKTALLALLDSYVPRNEWRLPWPDLLECKLKLFLKMNWPIHRQRMQALTLANKALYLGRLSQKALHWFLWTFGLRSTPRVRKPGHPQPPANTWPDYDYYADLVYDYIFKNYPGPVTLLCAQDKHRLVRLNQITNWRNLAGGGLEVRDLPGDHTAIFHPTHMPHWADQIRQCLAAAQLRYPPSP